MSDRPQPETVREDILRERGSSNFLEKSSTLNHPHADYQDSNQTEDQDSPLQHGTNQGDSHHGVPHSRESLGRLDRRVAFDRLIERFQNLFPTTACRHGLSVMTKHERIVKHP